MPNHRFHGSVAWKKARRIARIEAKHTCAKCNAYLPGKGELHVHHRKPIERAPALALEPLNFMVLCSECHNVVEPRTGSRQRSACDEQGRPLDPEHPWNLKAGAGRSNDPA
jgi:5-methylcytosine-specific restriction protein A